MKSSDDVDVILEDLAKILYKKHKDYGPMNIAGAPGGPMNGLRVRMYDKLARLTHPPLAASRCFQIFACDGMSFGNRPRSHHLFASCKAGIEFAGLGYFMTMTHGNF